jgi:GTP-binding protein
MDAVNRELAEYGGGLEERDQIVAVNKVDLAVVRRRVPALRELLASRGIDASFISAAEGEGTEDLVRSMAEALAARREERPAAAVEVPKLRPRPLGRGFSVRREGEAFRVEGERVAAFVEMMPVEMEEGRQETWWRLGRWGVSGALRRAGAVAGDRVRLGKVELEWPG